MSVHLEKNSERTIYQSNSCSQRAVTRDEHVITIEDRCDDVASNKLDSYGKNFQNSKTVFIDQTKDRYSYSNSNFFVFATIGIAIGYAIDYSLASLEDYFWTIK